MAPREGVERRAHACSVAATRLHSPQPHFIRRRAKVTAGLSGKRRADAVEIGLRRAGVEVDRDAIARGGQLRPPAR